MPENKKSIHIKIAAIVAKKVNVEKNGKNISQGYDYATIADIKRAVQTQLAEFKLCYTGSIEGDAIDRVIETKNGHARITRVKMKFILTDGESGENIESLYVGDGMDSGDKGIYKAYTGAEKYYLIQTFGIAIGDDPEADNSAAKEKPKKPTVAKKKTVKEELKELFMKTNAGKTAEEKTKIFVDTCKRHIPDEYKKHNYTNVAGMYDLDVAKLLQKIKEESIEQ